VDLPRRTRLLRKTKNGDALSSAAVEVLSGLRRGKDGPVFGIMTGRAVSHAFAKVCQRANLADLHSCDWPIRKPTICRTPLRSSEPLCPGL
jgi:hypothetical protein